MEYSGVCKYENCTVYWHRPTPDEISDAERARLEQEFADTAFEIMLRCKKREIENGNGDRLEEMGLGYLPDV